MTIKELHDFVAAIVDLAHASTRLGIGPPIEIKLASERDAMKIKQLLDPYDFSPIMTEGWPVYFALGGVKITWSR